MPSAPEGGAARRACVVRPFEPGDRGRWDALVRGARAPHFMLERAYMEYHADRFEDASLLVCEGDRLVAALPASRSGDHVVSHGGLTFGGLVTDRRATAGRVVDWIDALVDHLRADGVRCLTWKPLPHIYHAVAAEEELYALWRLGARLVARDLSQAVRAEERLAYTKGRRAAVKRAGGLHVAREHEFGEFWAVEEQVLAERHGSTPVHSLAEIAELAARFPAAIRLLTARERPSGPLLGGVVTFETPVVVHTQYIAASPAGREAGAVDAVVDHLLRTLPPAVRWFDLGTSMLDRGAALNVGLVRNKESYGARGVVYDRYELQLDAAPHRSGR